jgi:hypothetical protein
LVPTRDAFLESIVSARRRDLDPIGAGTTRKLEGAEAVGHELVLDGELVALSALAV